MRPDQAAAFMAHALRLADRGRYTSHPNPSVGCVIVRDGQVVGEGFHARAGEAHAEPLALAQAGERARGADLFVTLEPCSHFGRTPPCADALVAAGIRKVWAALEDPNPKVAGQGIARLREAGIEVEVGLMQREASLVHRGYLSRLQRGRPWVTLKLAASLDGRTAMASGESRWITGEAARADVHRMRAQAGAVLTTAATVLVDDPELSVRLPGGCGEHGIPAASQHLGSMPGEWRQPDRIVLDSQARVPAGARVWAEGARRFWLTAGEGEAPAGVSRLTLATDGEGHMALPPVLAALAQQDVNHVLVECGAQLAGAILRQKLADVLVTYLAPQLLGHEARPLAVLPGLDHLAESVKLQWVDCRTVGTDLRLTAVPV